MSRHNKVKKLENCLSEIARIADVSSEALTSGFRVELFENTKLLIENHKGISEYTEEYVKINCGKLIMSVYGNGLTLVAMNDGGLSLSGDILSISFSN